MGKISPFQIIIITVFVVLGVLAVLVFSGVINLDKTSQQTGAKGAVTMWGTYKHDLLSRVIDSYNQKHQDYSLVYVEKNASTFDTDLTEAIASGEGPDLILLPQDGILRNQTKLFKIMYTSLPERTFRDTYIQEGELYMLPDGVIGLPLAVDPLIMYYNRNMFEAAGLTQAPKTWDALSAAVPSLTKKTANATITQSAIPFGVFSNLNHAKDILSLLLLQINNPIVLKRGSEFIPVLNQKSDPNASGTPAQAVLEFFTQFSDPLKETYTWNRSFGSARDQFINEQLAVYFGYASELPTIAAKNPNLNFDIAKIPQVANTRSEVTFGQMQAVAIVKASKNFNSAFIVASEITSHDMADALINSLLESAPIAPARRDLFTKIPPNLYGPTLYNSAVIARGWYDPGDAITNPIFSDLVDNVIRGALNIGEAINQANSKLELVLK